MDGLIMRFIWNNKKAGVKMKLQLLKERGGIDLPDLQPTIKQPKLNILKYRC